ncbi:MAG: ATP-binding protein [Synergistaceae bacterium]|nr:ATP-binding protein [Synergistaceae bacterium]
MKAELIALREFEKDEVFACISGLIKSAGQIDDGYKQEAISWYYESVSRMAEAAELMGISGNIWQSWITMLFAKFETTFSLAQERRQELSGTLSQLVKEDIETIRFYFNFDLNLIDKDLEVSAFGRCGYYEPLLLENSALDRSSGHVVRELAEALRNSGNTDDFYEELLGFHYKHGSGQYALNKAFRWDGKREEIVPVTHTEEITLEGLVGYDPQKKILVDNTVAFLEGRPANNVLLYGESGTGKSSTVKALLNRFAPQGLRMVEVYKHQIEDLKTIVDLIKTRNYKFVVFMDDLSFEHFEVEYKFLKAFIEGGLEKRPDNILIYATSNRRHLMKEAWADRDDKYEDMHESETMQERMSLVDRFGLMIRYFSPEQEEYLNIVRTLAKEYKVDATEEELVLGAIRWELKHGGFSGRAARQFVEFMAGRKE